MHRSLAVSRAEPGEESNQRIILQALMLQGGGNAAVEDEAAHFSVAPAWDDGAKLRTAAVCRHHMRRSHHHSSGGAVQECTNCDKPCGGSFVNKITTYFNNNRIVDY